MYDRPTKRVLAVQRVINHIAAEHFFFRVAFPQNVLEALEVYIVALDAPHSSSSFIPKLSTRETALLKSSK
jgi:hypothetical protein